MSNHLVSGLLGAIDPGRTFLEASDGGVLTYGDFAALAGRFAGALDNIGVVPGDRVAVQVEKSVAALALYLGCVRAGAIFLPLNTAYTRTELDYFIADAEPRLLVVDPARQAGLADLATVPGGLRVETLGAAGEGSLAEAAAGCDASFEDRPRAPDDLAAILYTSGTTGRSKGAMLTHDNLLSNALTLRDAWRFTRDDVLLHVLPIFHTHGLFVATNTVMTAGAAMLFLPRFDAKAVVGLLPRVSTMMGVPTLYVRLLAEAGLAEAARGIRLFTSGSAPLLSDTHEAFTRLTGHAILERYGMTETNMNTSNPYEGPRVPGRVGPPLPGVAVRVTDRETGAPLP